MVATVNYGSPVGTANMDEHLLSLVSDWYEFTCV